MRYTRNRQLGKLHGYKFWKNSMNFPIKDMNQNELDKTFKWHREYNNVSFDVTHYYPQKMTVPLFVDLYKEDSVYY